MISNDRTIYVFDIACGPTKRFENIPVDHEWNTLDVGKSVDIYHSNNKWGASYKVVSINLRTSNTVLIKLEMEKVVLTCKEDGHNKQWSAEKRNYYAVITRWGKIPLWSGSKSFTHTSITEALNFMNEKIEEKLKKGYTSKP